MGEAKLQGRCKANVNGGEIDDPPSPDRDEEFLHRVEGGDGLWFPLGT
jgi:hypothetical protein